MKLSLKNILSFEKNAILEISFTGAIDAFPGWGSEVILQCTFPDNKDSVTKVCNFFGLPYLDESKPPNANEFTHLAASNEIVLSALISTSKENELKAKQLPNYLYLYFKGAGQVKIDLVYSHEKREFLSKSAVPSIILRLGNKTGDNHMFVQYDSSKQNHIQFCHIYKTELVPAQKMKVPTSLTGLMGAPAFNIVARLLYVHTLSFVSAAREAISQKDQQKKAYLLVAGILLLILVKLANVNHWQIPLVKTYDKAYFVVIFIIIVGAAQICYRKYYKYAAVGIVVLSLGIFSSWGHWDITFMPSANFLIAGGIGLIVFDVAPQFIVLIFGVAGTLWLLLLILASNSAEYHNKVPVKAWLIPVLFLSASGWVFWRTRKLARLGKLPQQINKI